MTSICRYKYTQLKRSTLKQAAFILYIFLPDTDDYASFPCENTNMPTCIDRLNGHFCSCVNGYEGTACETVMFHIGIS